MGSELTSSNAVGLNDTYKREGEEQRPSIMIAVPYNATFSETAGDIPGDASVTEG